MKRRKGQRVVMSWDEESNESEVVERRASSVGQPGAVLLRVVRSACSGRHESCKLNSTVAKRVEAVKERGATGAGDREFRPDRLDGSRNWEGA